ncbi:P-loop containing nucleoside triphosphate hydrolase protein [Crepidotus variabilis]|uniref:P-loop containing nucleoside triphosphate hydrolase protein n=1 Tax=Crepidotus variabilis TaxID=179855 RepID=A0A9P6JK46_9AGAR|nr:P-loop containing nucleoside triphosphate hydrolase protein [Crepidotus variabilis]
MPKVLLIGVGGPTCSGKTTIAKHLNRILPNSVIIHQDDFAPPEEFIPIHPVHKVQDWDTAEGAISWDRLIDFLRQVKMDGVLPNNHQSQDYLSKQKVIHVDEAVQRKWAIEFKRLEEENRVNGNEEIVWGLVEGFLLYWHPELINLLDVRIMLRVPHDVLKKRRYKRHGYHSEDQLDPASPWWRDPPGAWEDIIYPAYVDAHKMMFEGGDVEHGKPTNSIDDLVLLETSDITTTDAIERCCRVIKAVADGSRS